MGSSLIKKIKHYDTLITTVLVILVSIVLVAFVYRKMYRLTEKNAWNRISATAEDVGSNFSETLQYQSLYLSDYAQIIIDNNIESPGELEAFAGKFFLSSGVFEVYLLLPDNRVIGEQGKLVFTERMDTFGRISKMGEHFSHFKQSDTMASSFYINHY